MEEPTAIHHLSRPLAKWQLEADHVANAAQDQCSCKVNEFL